MTRGVPSDQTRDGWWYRASREDKLAQVDGAIALGLTASVVAKNCGASKDAIFKFAHWHGRRFAEAAEVRRVERPRFRNLTPSEQKRLLGEAYFSGEPVNFGGWQ